MTRKRTEAVVLVSLLAGCVGAVFFIYVLMTGPGSAFDMRDSTAAPPPRAASPHRADPAPPAAEPPIEPIAAEEAPTLPETARALPPAHVARATQMPADEPTEDLARRSAELTLELVAPVAEEDRKELERIFLDCLRYEYLFWEMAYRGEAWPG